MWIFCIKISRITKLPVLKLLLLCIRMLLVCIRMLVARVCMLVICYRYVSRVYPSVPVCSICYPHFTCMLLVWCFSHNQNIPLVRLWIT